MLMLREQGTNNDFQYNPVPVNVIMQGFNSAFQINVIWLFSIKEFKY